MRIAQSTIQLTGIHSFNKEKIHEEKLDLWIGGQDNQESGPSLTNREDRLDLSPSAVFLAAKNTGSQAIAVETTDENGENPKIRAMRLILEKLTGKKIKISKFEIKPDNSGDVVETPGKNKGAGWGLSYDYLDSYHEQEETKFKADGTIKTVDGREINFQLELAMSREFYQETAIHIRAGDAKSVDPLVINFGGSAAELTDAKFAFDLDNDGREEKIARLGRGSGYLALDLNDNGRIDNGRELFGPKSGNGFAELSTYDSDNNKWLDEKDPVYDKLRVWIQDSTKGNYLAGLKEMNIGALYLEPTQTTFQLTSQNNEQLGSISETGIYIRENGSPGSIQEIFVTI